MADSRRARPAPIKADEVVDDGEGRLRETVDVPAPRREHASSEDHEPPEDDHEPPVDDEYEPL